jgi:lipoprotein-anchoring transpeptidase ErfK/SrfK
MSALRALGLAYLASASLFAMAAMFAAHPGLAPLLKQRSQFVAENFRHLVTAGLARREPGAVFLPGEPVPRRVAVHPSDTRSFAQAPLPSIVPQLVAPQGDPRFAVRADDIIAPDLPPQQSAPPVEVARVPDIARTADRLSPENERAASLRLKASLTPEMLAHFDLFLYVSKANKGPLAQRLYVFQKQQGNGLALAYDWPASTGREQNEISPLGRRAFTDTPRGYYQLDPDRMYWRYHSHAWDQAMPYAMFFNWERQGLQTGLAIHGASGDDIVRLGHRASAGCVHIAPENAKLLYRLIRSHYKGEVPRFAYDPRSRTVSNSGDFLHDAKGKVAMNEGYRVLIYIEDYGGENVVAALF